MTDLQSSQVGVYSVLAGDDAALRVSQVGLYAIMNFPSEEMQITQVGVYAPMERAMPIEVSQVSVYAVVRGIVDNPRVRAWTFTLDGHDMYVINLGTSETLLYDMMSGEWYQWGSGSSPLWRAVTGTNWLEGRHLAHLWSDVVVGDVSLGVLYFLSPDDAVDDDAVDGVSTPRPFTRSVTAQFVVPYGYASVPCFGVQLFGSLGQSSVPGSVSLTVSDDRGENYVDAGSVAVGTDRSVRAIWPSLGSMNAPGRLFVFTDTGALKRLDKLFMEEPE